MTFQALYQESARLALDPDYNAFSIDHYKQWVNDGNLYVAKELPLSLVSGLFATASQILTVVANFLYSLPSDCIRPIRILRENVGCIKVNKQKWDAVAKNSYLAPSVTEPYTCILGDKFYIKPVSILPDGVDNGIEVQYVKRPAVMVATDSTPDIDSQYHYLIARYAAYIAKSVNQDENALVFKQEIDNKIKSLKETVEIE